MKLTPSEKKLYWILWGFIIFAAAVWFSWREIAPRFTGPSLSVSKDSAVEERFSEIDIAKKGLDFIELEFELTPAFTQSIGRFPKLLTLGYVLRRDGLVLDFGEFPLNLQPSIDKVSARLPNRKKVDFSEIHLHLPH